MYEKILAILLKYFIYCEDFAKAISLALEAGENAIVFGPGGHAKSAMMEAIIRELPLDDCYIKSFDEGCDVADLFGGLNFKRFETDGVLEYYPENSFMSSSVAIFEEGLDMRPKALSALKDVLTSGWLRNGKQRYQSRCQSVIILTNREPSELSEMGPAIHALMERFPVQLNLKWKSYEAKDYNAMFSKYPQPLLNGFSRILAEIFAKATSEGNFVSPRTAMKALAIVQASARMRGVTRVEQCDLVDLRFLPGMAGIAETIEQDLRQAMEKAEAESKISKLEKDLEYLRNNLSNSTPIKAIQIHKQAASLADEAGNLRVPDGLVERRKNLRNNINSFAAAALDHAVATTR